MEHIDNMKWEMGLFSQHLKRIDHSRPKSPESGVPGYDEEILKSVRSHLTSIEKEQEKMALKNKDDLDKVLESLDEKQVSSRFSLADIMIMQA